MRFLILIFVFLISCSYFPAKKKSKPNSCRTLLSLLLIPPPSVGDFYSQIFYINPIFLSSKDYNFIERISDVTVSVEKKQILFVHGLQPKDTDSVSFPTEQDLKLRLLDDIWKESLETNFFQSLMSKGYDIYLYTYLTSNNISANGTRLRTLLDKHFFNLSNFYILAHSMGGLVVRDAIYKNNSNLQIKEIYTIGTPFHGSPWASPQFQENRVAIGEYAASITQSAGGKDLAWDNFDDSLFGSSNTYLSEMNSKTEKDFLITAFYGSLDKNASGYLGSQTWLNAGCLSLGNKFSPSDCIVPVSSAMGDGLNFKARHNLGSYNHFDIKFGVADLRNYFFNLLP